MHEGLTAFIATLDRAASGLATGASAFFILDQQAIPDVQTQLFATGEVVEPIPLYQGTEFEHLAEIGPLWFAATPGSALWQRGKTLCEEHAAGISVHAQDGQAAQEHARRLLQVNDGSGGQSLIAYYTPDMWAALAMTQTASLFGPWDTVYSPAPRHISNKPSHWLPWQSMPSEQPGLLSGRYSLAPSTQATHRTLRWLYWIDGYYQAFNSPTPGQLPGVLDNLELLVDYGLTEGRWLVRLADLAGRGAIADRETAMAILRSQEEPFIRVDQLQALAL